MTRSALVVLFLVTAVTVFSRGIFEAPPKLLGTVIAHPTEAADFTLVDQHGQPFHMAGTRGKVVVVTFIYTHCTDLCPFMTLKLKEAIDQLGPEAAKAAFVAVTTDPARDTPSVNAAYSKAAGLFDTWHFVTGTTAAVKDVWYNYGVGAEIEKPASDEAAPQSGKSDAEPIQGLSSADANVARQIAMDFGGGYDVTHSAPFWFIDRKGRIRAVMDADVRPSDIAANVRALVRS